MSTSVKSEVNSDDDEHDSIGAHNEEEQTAEHSGECSVPGEVWSQFHAIQATQWAQALSQARVAKKQATATPGGSTSAGFMNGLTTPLGGGSIGLLGSLSGGSSGGKRCKAYAAPKGVWKNNGGYNATIYVHKRRIYGPIRRDLSDAIEDRKEMEDALRELTAIHNSPDDAGILEVEMRDVVAGLRNRSTPNGPCPSRGSNDPSATTPLMSLMSSSATPESRKRLRLVGSTVNEPTPTTPELTDNLSDVMGPFGDLQFQPEMEYQHFRGLTPHLGPTPNMGPMRDNMFAGSPGISFSLGGGAVDDCMLLPDPLESIGGLWGAH
jgi:hypothetical protein